MKKIQLKSSVCINSYMRIDKWGDTYWVIENVNDSYMFGVIENDRKHKSSDFHVSFYYRG